ncbi:Transposon TX1 uncharacterized 149 kDa protein [Vitis vinifera]|uniref:Transposon TX1 uncharacterized 149 kDa protein n=1 Tax=Vitis vinifera TaxID=29760 RepID=A0A438FAV2_VITVI|nr:Transposon TX1 uncharacterized 149 kDa protein [Vitis vinifera]
MIRFPSERSRGGRLSSTMRRFSEVVKDLELRDLPLQGGLFTWSGGLNNRLVSDHSSILLDGEEMRRGPMPFRFENMWLKEESFKEVLRKWWEGIQVETKKQSAWNLVDFWDKEESARSLSMEEGEARKEARETYKKWMANAHRRRNQLTRVKVNGRWLTEESEIKEEVSKAFQGLLADPGGWKPNIDGLIFERLEELDVEGLEKPFSKEEVEVMNFFRQFHESGSFVRSLNATFLVLIPKKGRAEDLKDFKPISLVGGLYKWLTKVLANRLKRVLAKVISTSQNAFVEGRQIMDAMLIANKAIDSILKSNRGAILCKLDIEKTYDHVDWSFLLAVLEKMGFGEKWRRWIRWCLSTVRFSVLVNGTPTGFFQSSRGLRQGDPLLLYLFVIVMETFNRLLKRAVSGGLRMNLEKSELIPIGRVENVEELAEEFGYKMGRLPSTYLGMSLGAPFESAAAWDEIKERFRKRLAMWKRQYISKGGGGGLP